MDSKYHEDCKMTSEELRRIKDAMGWSNGDISRHLGVNRRTARYWCNDRATIPRPAARAIREIYKNHTAHVV